MKHFIVVLLTLFCGRAIAQRATPDVISTDAGQLSIQPINHATLVMTVGGKAIYADPTGGAAAFTGLPAPDLIVVTDIHGDHFSPETLTAIVTANTQLVVPQVVADKLPDALKARAVVMHNGDHQKLLGFGITALPMYNLPDGPNAAMHTKGRGNGYVLAIGGKNIYLSGDTQGIPEMRALRNIDVAFVCMNLPYTMDVKEAADAVLAFKPKIVYPYHYRGQGGFSDVAQFKTLVAAGDPSIDVRLRTWYPAQGK
ncbi:MAG TPA: MBL fold metallo-hydrolase [Dinghuibacter sp.]|jgi:L-ascorbate metabolism protein UlaG (beta-lactamase superfamily)|uniref:MBL fold metallo-hydrolase n=1 Tax=Dinghuibacter sp. TaxID=2024697 RepID=UPI002B81415B|nr:MBL fold metallo-hydrolase [Dinghuibacter sp.]HTJ14872.1 MBL fold metallo-hydrolase [Dinghuibacter sp.]